MNGKLHNHESFSFDEAELVTAAGMVREAMLKVLPEPEACTHEFSEAFRVKMKKLLEWEKRRQAFTTVRRWAAAVILLVLVSGAAVLTVDTEARAEFFAWVREVYENSIVYRFFNEPEEETLPDYELGWVPEGYELVELYKDENLYSAVYQKNDDVEATFVFDYSYIQVGGQLVVWADESKHEHKELMVKNIEADFYCSLDSAEPSELVWIDDELQIIFTIQGYLDELDMLHIAESVFLDKTTN